MKRLCFLFTTLFFTIISTFALDVSEISSVLSEFANDNGGRLPLSSDIGLGWSDAYIGQLMDLPPHFGFGITLGVNSMKTDKLKALTDVLELPEVSPWFAGKQLFPAYALETRIGGFQNAAFDIGIKIGYFPDIFALNGSYSYENLVFGGDIRININRGYGNAPKISLGFGVNYLSGHYSVDSYTEIWDSLNPNSNKLYITWDTITILLKFSLSKAVANNNMTVFAGANLGYAITNTGLAIVGDTIQWNGANMKDMNDKSEIAPALNNMISGTKWEVKEDGKFGVWGGISGYAIALHLNGGFSIDFSNDLRLQFALAVDLVHLEFGLNFGFRWQQ
ncbi:MAG: hypothetical protein LBT01_08520 [Spirochaetaceae bacterium]|jgi:hypothetical protein|nr:hypothetical protein [Spirochaetaceae bacterium]